MKFKPKGPMNKLGFVFVAAITFLFLPQICMAGGIDTAPGTSTLPINVEGNNVMTLLSSGDVGIGTTNPIAMLDVNGWIRTSSSMLTNQIMTLSTSDNLTLETNGSPVMTLTNAGNVGIGTTDPSATLQVVTNGFPTITAQSTVHTSPTVALLNALGQQWEIQSCDGTNGGCSPNNGFMVFNRNAMIAPLTIDTAGYVGIGTTSPSTSLTVSDNIAADATRFRIINASSRIWDVGVIGSNAGWGPGSFAIGDISAGTWRMVIDSSGDVGFGGPNFQLLTPVVPFQIGNYTGSTNTIMGIAANPVGYSLELYNLWASGFLNAASYYINGGCWAGNCASDVRLKDHIRPFKPGLEALLAVNPVYYRFTGAGGMEKSISDNIGVIAQDVEKGAPELVGQKEVKLHPGDTAETEIKTVNYTALPYMLINAVKEFYGKWQADHEAFVSLTKTVAEQQAEITELREEIAKLKAKPNQAP